MKRRVQFNHDIDNFFIFFLNCQRKDIFLRNIKKPKVINDTYPTHFEWDKNFITTLSGINEFHYRTQWDK
jgi:hypothetical protein